MFRQALATIGAATAAIAAVRFLRFIYLHCRPSSIHRYLRPDAWAVVTGASDGIGLAFAHDLAGRGMNIVLHGRNPEKLDRVRQDLQQAFPERSFRVLIADATHSQGMEQAIEGMVDELSSLPGPLTVMINNVGGTPFISETFRALEDYSGKDVDDMINLNVRFQIQLTRRLLPILKKSSPALIVNLGSIAGALGLPLVTLYSGAKAFIMWFSVGFARELAILKQDIECIGLIVGTTTGTATIKSPAVFMMQPNTTTLVKAAIQKVGCGRPLVVPYWGHAVLHFIVQALPGSVQSVFFKRMIDDFQESQRATRSKAE